MHGIPGERVLLDGDQISIDCGAIVSGWHGDAAITVGVGEVSAPHVELSRVTEEALWRGLAVAVAGGTVRDIGIAVESSVRAQPGGDAYGIVEEYVGHGIGTSMHMDPNVPNYDHGGKSPSLVPGMALAIEPMVCAGSRLTRTLADDWTVVSSGGHVAAHWEHTVAITPEGPWVLTALDGGAARFAALGVASPAVRRAAGRRGRPADVRFALPGWWATKITGLPPEPRSDVDSLLGSWSRDPSRPRPCPAGA